MGIFNFRFLKRNNPHKIVVCGLDNSGKSTMISFLKEGKFVEHTPTMGKEKSEIEIQGTKMALYDMGGQKDFREFWLSEMKGAKCLIFVVDKADKNRYEEAKQELEKLLPNIKKNNIKLLFILNKYDLASDIPLGKIITYFQLHELDNFEIFQTSARTGYGMADTFANIYSHLTGKLIKKDIVAKAVSIWDKAGIPLVTKANEKEFDMKVLEGGFLSAISNFADMHLESNSITFRSEKNGTYVVIKSENYIGSLLWNKNLSIPIEESENALKALLEHLETVAASHNREDIVETVYHYCTNIL